MKIGFIGMGNMARAIVEGWLRSEALHTNEIYAVAKHYDRLCDYAKAVGIHACETIGEAVSQADSIVIAVKPDVVESILPDLDLRKPILSVATGWTCERYLRILGASARIQYILPNTPCKVNKGILLFEEQNTLNDSERIQAKELFGALGLIETLPSAKMTPATAISGCGPAFGAMVIEALADAGVQYGLPRQTAYRLASQMLVGTGTLQLETGLHPGILKDAVCSPGGSTIRGVEALEAHGLRSAMFAAVKAVEEFY